MGFQIPSRSKGRKVRISVKRKNHLGMMWKEKQGKKMNLVNEAALSDTSLRHYDMQHIVTTS